MIDQLTPGFILGIVALYFLVLIAVSYFTSKDTANSNFFLANRQSPWYLVAFGMVGATLSGVTFISIPGVVGAGGNNMAFSYMQMVFGYLVGYAVIALVLMPVYYRLNLTSIYGFLDKRFGFFSYKTGAGYFLLSRVIGASFRLYIVAMVLQYVVMDELEVPFWLTVMMTIILIWVYTFRGGIKTIVWTDVLQTICILSALILTIFAIAGALEKNIGELVSMVHNSEYGQMFFFENGWGDPNNFFKQFISGAFMAIVMTGLDQDMMQKNLTCKSLKEAQLNVFAFSIILVIANILFLTMGALLYLYAANIGLDIPAKSDQLYPMIALNHLSPFIGIVFILGLVAAAYSSADSALTSLTTSFCVDFLDFEKRNDEEEHLKKTRFKVHVGFSILLFLVILIFHQINDDSVINSLFKVAGYTYGPLLGLYAFGLFMKQRPYDRSVPIICVLAPILTFLISSYSDVLFFGYEFGFELLLINGLLTFLGLVASAYWLGEGGDFDLEKME